jgi:uncharacterized repeat protein (TIGR01451 family)
MLADSGSSGYAKGPGITYKKLTNLNRQTGWPAVAAVLSLVVLLLMSSGQRAASAPGTPRVPQDPIVIFTEDFENGQPTDPLLLSNYTGAGPLNMTYTAHQAWLQNCNGHVMSWNNATLPADWTCTTGHWSTQRTMAAALGTFAGAPNSLANNVVGAFTGTNSLLGADLVQFETESAIPVLPNGFYTFSVDAGAANCGASSPLLKFYLLDGDDEIAAHVNAINVCADFDEVISGVRVGRHVSDAPVLFTGSELGIRMRNGNGLAAGNDGVFDNIRLLDVTPQMDKEFSPNSVVVGQAVALTFTITNTSELASKEAWSFTETLSAGLVVANPANASTDCTNGTVDATTGGDAISVSGDLEAGQAFCQVTVSVTAEDEGTYENCDTNITAVEGLNLPACDSVTFSPLLKISITKTANPAGGLISGGTVEYTLTIANVSGRDAFDLLLEDDLPDGIDSAIWTCVGGDGATCPNDDGALPLSESIPELLSGGFLVYTITGDVSDEPPLVIVNTASVSDTDIVCAEDGSQQPCFATVANPPVPIVSIAKSTLTPVLMPTGTAIFEVVVRNAGVVDADGSTVTDPVPAGLTGFDAWTCEAEGSAVCPNDSGSGALNETIATFPAGSLLRWTITATVVSSPPGTILNTASILPPEESLCIDASEPPCTAAAQIGVQFPPSPPGPTATPSPTPAPDPFDDATQTPTRTATPTPTATTTSPTPTPDPSGAVAGITPPQTGDGGLAAP